MNSAIMEDVNFIAQQSSGRINMILSGMTALMKDTDNKVSAMESQDWFQRMIKTVTGKNKATAEEIRQNHEKLSVYMSEAIAELYNRNCIDYKVMINLGYQINEIYASHLKLKQMLGAFSAKLNEKINSVDNFNMLINEIDQGVYSDYSPIVAICKIQSQFDNRILEDERKLDIIIRSMDSQNILTSKEVLLSEYLNDIIDVPAEEAGEIYMGLGTIRGNLLADLCMDVIEEYHFLSNLARKMKNTKTLISDAINNRGLDDKVKLTSYDIYDDFLEHKKNVAGNIVISTSSQNDNQDEEIQNDDSQDDDVNCDELLEKGKSCYENEEYEEALPLFKKAFEQGSGDAAFYIGQMYAFGRGIGEDSKEAFLWYKRATELKSLKGMSALAYDYYYGEGTEQNIAEAIPLLEILSNEGSSLAICLLGRIAEDEGNYDEAFKRYTVASERGLNCAHYYLAFCYSRGLGVTKNQEKAFELFKRAAEQGYEGAEVQLAILYHYGEGITKDENQARKWINSFISHGYTFGKEFLAQWYGEYPEEILQKIAGLCRSYARENGSDDFMVTDKLRNTLGAQYEEVYLAHDDTIFQNGKNGFAITRNGIYCRGFMSSQTIHTSFYDLAKSKEITLVDYSFYADDNQIAYMAYSLDKQRNNLLHLFKEIASVIKTGLEMETE